MRRKLLPLVLGGALSIAAIAPAAAADQCSVPTDNRGGAAALVALVQANVQAGVGVNVCDVQILNNSLNNLLQNADIHVLENILNNSPILNDSLNNWDIQVVALNGTGINILGAGFTIVAVPPLPAP